MSEFMRSYAGDKWEFDKRDCIGLMFELINATSPHYFDRSNYVPRARSFHDTCRWLIEHHEHPTTPYRHLLEHDAKLNPSTNETDAQIILVMGWEPLKVSDDELYPIDQVPGLVFKPPSMQHHIFARKGMAPINLYSKKLEYIYRYKLDGYR